MDSSSLSYGFIGFGHMGSILCKAFQKGHLVSNSHLFFTRKDDKKKVETEKNFHIKGMKLPSLLEQCDCIFLCVKPQDIPFLMPELKKVDFSKKCLISIAAGKKISYFEKELGALPLVRAIPNIASSINEGMTLLTFSSHVSSDYKGVVKRCFALLGLIEEVEEKWLDLTTALASSMPAFAAFLIEGAAKKAHQMGFSYEKALFLISQAFIGSAKLIQKGKKPEDLLREVASPSGMTEKGLNFLKEHQAEELLAHAFLAALERAKEL